VKALVLLKKTPDTEAKIKVSGDGKSIDFSDTKFIINPYDEFAIEEALQVKQKAGDCEVVVCSFGDESTRELIVKALAMGADRGLLIGNEGLTNADSLTVAKILAAAIKSENPDLVFAGRHAIDDDNMHVPTMVAEILGWPHINVVTKLEVSGAKATVERAVEGGQVEVYEVGLPCVIGADKALNQPRYASLPGIMKAKKKPLDKKSPAEIGANVSGTGKSTIVGFSYPPEKPPGQVFKGEPVEAMVAKVVKALREEAKVL
jgi:electron transfer flavoprotein beta subunit